MSNPHSDALVFFGATGDLAYKKIFPALQAMVKRGHLDVPVVGVAKAGWNLDQLRARAYDSLEKHGGVDPAVFEKLTTLLRYVDGDYQDPATFAALPSCSAPVRMTGAAWARQRAQGRARRRVRICSNSDGGSSPAGRPADGGGVGTFATDPVRSSGRSS